MDGITTIVIIFVLVNVIKAIIKAVGKSQQSEKPPVPNASMASIFKQFDEQAERDGAALANEDYFDHATEEIIINTGAGTFHYSIDDDQSFVEVRQRSDAESAEPLKENLFSKSQGSEEITEVVSGQSLVPAKKKQEVSLPGLFSDKESFITAYIFHEVLEPPLALRKNREKSSYGC